MDKSNGYSRRKYEKQCCKHWVTWRKVEWSGVGWIWEAYSGAWIFHLTVCVMANRRKDGGSMDYLTDIITVYTQI